MAVCRHWYKCVSTEALQPTADNEVSVYTLFGGVSRCSPVNGYVLWHYSAVRVMQVAVVVLLQLVDGTDVRRFLT